MRILFFGTPHFSQSALQALLAEKFNVVAVFTQPDRPKGRGKKVQPTPIKIFAQGQGLPVFDFIKFKSNQAAKKTITELNPDLVVVVAYGNLLPTWLLELPKFGCINIHPSLLPKYRGAAPIRRAMMAGEVVTGVSLMQLDEGLDSGPVIYQVEEVIDLDITYPLLAAKLFKKGAELVVKYINELIRGKTPQLQRQNDEEATYAAKIVKGDQHINWEKSARKIHKQVSALTPDLAACCLFRDKLIKIMATTMAQPNLIDDKNKGSVGKLLVDEQKRLFVQCIDHVLEILTLKPESKKEISAKDFINGFRLAQGERLVSLRKENSSC